MVTITIEKTDSPTRREKNSRSINSPNTAAAANASGKPAHIGKPICMIIHQTRKPPNTTSSPWAKLNTLEAR